MLDEKNNKDNAKKDSSIALDQLTKAMNASQVAHLQLVKFIKDLPSMQHELDPVAEQYLSILSKKMSVTAKRLKSLINAYENSDIANHIEHGDLNMIIRNNSVTCITEQLATDLSDIMISLKQNSLYDREKSDNSYYLAV